MHFEPSRRYDPIHRLLWHGVVWQTSLVLTLSLASLASAQSPESGAADADRLASEAEELAPIAESVGTTPDPFGRGVSLQAHKLRGLTTEVASLVLRGNPGGPIAFETSATPLRGEGDKAYVPVLIEIDGPSFLEANQSDTARIEIYVYALGTGQSVGDFLAEVFAVNVRELGEAVWQSGLKYYGHLNLAAGDYKLRTLVRNYHSKAAALREHSVHVPSSAELGQSFVSAPLFEPPMGRDGWLPIREGSGSGRSYPFVADRRALRPAVRPVLSSGRKVKAHLLTYDLPAGELTGRLELRRNGAAIAQAPLLQVSSREVAGSTGGEMLAVEFDVPPTEPGAYDLQVHLSRGSTSLSSTTVAGTVTQMAAGDQGLLWTDLRGRLTEASSPARVAAAGTAVPTEKGTRRRGKSRQERKKEQRANELAVAYRHALSQLGDGQQTAARSAILDMEAEVLTDGATEVLRAAELQVARELAETEVESLIPLIVLHDEIYLIYRQRNLFSLGSNARTVIEKLAELYAEQGGSEGSRIVASRALTSLAGRLQKANLPSSSRRLYQRALDHDPGNKAASLGLATSYERYGDYRQAVNVLERLVQIHPSYGEGALRLAINLQRLGLVTRTRDLLRLAFEEKSPGWIRALASQELARSLLVSGELEQATELLEKSVDEIPDQEATKYLLAHIYDRQKQPLKALDLLSHVEPSQADSARKVYDGWPREPLARVRNELSKAAQVRASLVARILEPGQPEEGR